MENISGATPTIDWESQDLQSAWKRFQVHVNFMFSGPLKGKTEEERCSYLMLWVGEKGRNIYSTWTIEAEREKAENLHRRIYRICQTNDKYRL